MRANGFKVAGRERWKTPGIGGPVRRSEKKSPFYGGGIMDRRCFKVLSPTAILGYGFPEESFQNGMEKRPHSIAVDAGSTDPGPYYLGAGKSFTARAAVKRDLEIILAGAVDASIPAIVGTAGGCGARPHVEWTEAIIREIAREKRLTFRMAVIYADVPKEDVLRALRDGAVRPLHPAPEIGPEEVEKSVRIVAQMGAEPVLSAMRAGAQVILCGRCYDPVPFAAPAIGEGFDPGLAVHMGKILECAAIAATPGSGRDCVLGILHEDCFHLESLNPRRAFTPLSTAAHTLYEKSNPYLLPGPGGAIDLRSTRFEAVDDRTVSVSGTIFTPAHPYTIKLEGVKRTGFRTVSIAGVRDPVLIAQIDRVLDAVRKESEEDIGEEGTLLFHVYGKDGVMGALEPERDRTPHEVGLVMEVIAADQERADAICSHVRSTLLHYGYPGRISTAGNLALLYSPSDIPCGEVFEFNIYHLMEVDDPKRFFPVHVVEVTP